MIDSFPTIRSMVIFGVIASVLGWAPAAVAQSPADTKRTIRAQQDLYKEPGMVEADVRYMRGTLMITGWVPTEAHVQKATEIGESVKGVKEVRNRLKVREPDVAAASDEQILAKIEKAIEDDEELAQSRRRLEIKVEGGNVTLEGRLKDYTLVSDLVRDVKRIEGVQSIQFDDLKW